MNKTEASQQQVTGQLSVSWAELHRLRGSNSILVEAEESALKVWAHQRKEDKRNNSWSAIKLLHSHTYRMPLLLTVIANAAQQFSGINAVSSPDNIGFNKLQIWIRFLLVWASECFDKTSQTSFLIFFIFFWSSADSELIPMIANFWETIYFWI